MAKYTAHGRAKVNAERTIPLERYTEDGHEDRASYLEGLSEEHGQPLRTVHELAQMLGPDEDFDGLVSTLEDATYIGL